MNGSVCLALLLALACGRTTAQPRPDAVKSAGPTGVVVFLPEGRSESRVQVELARQPVTPDDLRYLVTVLRIVPELERSADLVEHIALRAQPALCARLSLRARELVWQMTTTGAEMWRVAGDAFERRDATAIALPEPAIAPAITDPPAGEPCATLVSIGARFSATRAASERRSLASSGTVRSRYPSACTVKR